jgi:hypothetical protein
VDSFVRLYRDAVPADLCDRIIAAADASDQWIESPIGGGRRDPAVRQSLSIFFDDVKTRYGMEEQWSALDNEVFAVVKRVIDQYTETFRPLRQMIAADTGYQLQRIPRDSGFYREHIDHEMPGTPRRLLTVLLYLNDVTVGGETAFRYITRDGSDEPVRVTPVKGTALVMPVDWPWMHSGETPVSNDKYIITTFMIEAPE